MFSFVSRPPSRRSALGSTLAIVAMLGAAGSVLAGSGDARHDTKLAPLDRDVKARKAGIIAHTADGPAAAPAARAAAPASGIVPAAPPSNDECSGAVPIPDGPFPVVSAPVDISQATPQGSDDPDVCPANGVDLTIWFSFTPSISGLYIISTCADSAAGTTVYDTVLGVLDACPSGGSTVACNDTALSCSGVVQGAPYLDQSTANAVLTAGTTYYIAVGHWSQDVGGVQPGFDQLAVSVDLSPAPANDSCSNPEPLAVDRITFGTTAAANNDYRSPTSCFTGPGQTATTSGGLDVVYSFVPPENGKYSFRYVQDDTAAALRSQSPSLYLADNCPAPDPANPIAGCIQAANRMNDQTTGNGNRAEEIDCLQLTAGTPYYLFFDDRFTANPGGPFALEVTACAPESEPNDSIATATPFQPNSGCFMEGNSIPSGPAADIDFYDLGAPPAGSKVFLGVDAAAAGDSDFAMRLTNATDTLGFDDNDGTSWVGSNAPIITGPFADGSELYARINGVPALAGDGPYGLFARIETGAAQNESLPDPPPADVVPNGTVYGATHVTGGGFVKGIIYGFEPTDPDLDCFRFVAQEGDNILAFSDNNPARTSGTITNVWPVLLTIDGNPEPANARFVGQTLRNVLTPSPGTLTGTTPSVTSEFMHFRARYTGAYTICYEPTQDDTGTENPPLSAYPLPYQGSISINCGPIPGPGSADVSVTMTGPPSPANTGSLVNYTITLTNEGTDVAQDVRLVDVMPAELVYVGLSVDDGFGGSNTGCLSLPTPGGNDAPVDCTNYSLAPGASIIYTLSAQVGNCIGSGLSVVNTVSITTFTTDAVSGNDADQSTITTSEDGTCADLLCDVNGCIADGCTVNDHCDATGTCVSDPLNCDDNSVCTTDSCDPSIGCINDASQTGDLCFDGNDCTLDQCDPVLFCVFPPAAAGVSCSDFLNCTTGDACDGQGNCIGHSVCDDGLPCTDDFADEANSCACDNPLSFPGTICDDGNACTTGTVCDGLGGGVANCNGGGAIDCDDGIPCTDDACDPVAGCVHTPNPGVCDDGNACTTDTCDPASGCAHTNNTNPCDDGNECTQVDACSGGICVGSSPIVCTPSDSCHTAGVCDSSTGLCSNPEKDANSPCDDGNACTTNDHCDDHANCVADPALPCDDANACTADDCEPATGCYSSPANFDARGFSAVRIDGRDLELFAASWSLCPGDPGYSAAADLDHTDCVEGTDFTLFMRTFGKSCP